HWAPEEERPFLDVWFRDARNGFVIGAYGYFLVTGDGGDSWSEFVIALDEELGEDEDEFLYGYGSDYHLNQVAKAA
ncbi:MAG: hypothetical protein GTO46_12365, partial [Gemmatimonadetes bacterium]|nr:hypothetical protein [Gemmatimonadota bacterium]